MTDTAAPILSIHQTVREDTLAFREKLAAHLRGETGHEEFKACRVPMGIYEHRTDGRFMVRVRLGAGLALPRQLGQVAALSRAHGNGVLHVTTRQDIQIHDVPVESLADVVEGLLDAGLAARGGGGNTVRNVSACPRAGRCPQERFNVAPHAIAVAEYLLQHPGAFSLPRKYKIAFSGCGEDCALASIADLGFFARERNGEQGFKVFAGGGLGGSSRGGIVMEDFIPAHEAMEVAEAVRRVFDRHGDRTNRHRARLRHVLNRVGDEEFRALYHAERDALRAEGLPGDVPALKDLDARFARPAPDAGGDADPEDGDTAHLVLSEKTPGSVTLRLPLPLGDISADDLEVVVRIAQTHGIGLVGATQQQELLIYGIPRAERTATLALLRETAAFPAFSKPRPRVISCAGASTCKLGICLSRGLAAAVSDEFDRRDIREDITIRISGCPNSCGGHHIGAIGLEGRAHKHNGRLMPTYRVLAGGAVSEEGAQLAAPLGNVPAKRVPELLAEALRRGTTTPKALRPLVEEFSVIPEDVPEDYYQDFGANAAFSLAGHGPGEE